MAKSNKSQAETFFPVLLHYYKYYYKYNQFFSSLIPFSGRLDRSEIVELLIISCSINIEREETCQVNDKYYSRTGGGHLLVICRANPYISRNVAHRVSHKWVE